MNSHSWLAISQTDPRPLYLQIMQQIQRRVAVGDLPAGTELPSIRQLAADIKVSVITIKRAYMELERDGVIATRHGKGSVVAENLDLTRTLQEQELETHLQQVANLGMLLRKTKSELQTRIAEIYDQ